MRLRHPGVVSVTYNLVSVSKSRDIMLAVEKNQLARAPTRVSSTFTILCKALHLYLCYRVIVKVSRRGGGLRS